MDHQLEVTTLSVSDVDKAAAFYTRQAGFTLDVDYHPAGRGTAYGITADLADREQVDRVRQQLGLTGVLDVG